ncbi:MAG: RNA polymerase sigma factor SigZ [Acidobacteriota bacterium]
MQATERIWQDYHNQLLSFIRRRVRDTDMAEDILQDVFVKIHSRLDTLAQSERVQNWLYRIARNAVIDHYRTRKEMEPLPYDLPQTEPDDETWRELERCVAPMIEMLPDRYRDAVMMSEIEGLPLKEVAARLKLSLPGAKSRVQRGRQMLKQVFLDCCRFEFDCRGKPFDWSGKNGCSPVSC